MTSRAPRNRASSDRSRLVFLLTFLYNGLLPLLYSLRYPTVAPIYFFAGDTFYYLDIARRSLHTHGFTFDGVFPTNGFHPLWEYILVALGSLHLLSLGEGSGPLLRVFFVNLFLLSAGAAIFSATAARLLARPLLALLLTAPGLLWCATGLVDPLAGATWSFLNGMESALALFCFAVALWAAFRARLLLSAIFLGLATLARLDDIFLAAGVAVALLLQAPVASRKRSALLLLPFPAIVAAYLAYNLLSLGILLPISGGTKASFALLQNLKWAFSLILPVITGDGPSALLPGPTQYYGFGERTGRLLLMLLPAALCALELTRRVPRLRLDRRPTLLDGLYVGVLLKAAYNLAFVQVWYQGLWYYTVSLFTANLILILWIDQVLSHLRPHRSNSLVKLLPLHAFAVLFTFNIFLSKRNSAGPANEQHILVDSAPLRNKLRSLGADRIVEFDDGFTSYVANVPAVAGLGLALDPESARALAHNSFLPLMYRRGYRILVANGPYVTIVDNHIAARAHNQNPPLMEIHGPEFDRFHLRPLGGDGSPDGLSFYELVPSLSEQSPQER